MPLVSISDAAYLLKIPASTIRRWISEGRLAKHGRKPYRVSLSEVTRLAETRADLRFDITER